MKELLYLIAVELSKEALRQTGQANTLADEGKIESAKICAQVGMTVQSIATALSKVHDSLP